MELAFKLCFICQKNSKLNVIVKTHPAEFIDKVLNNILEHLEFKDVSLDVSKGRI